MKQSVKDGIAQVARDVFEERGGGNLAGFPLLVSMEVRERRPDIWRHLKRYWRHDPHQYIAMHIPEDVSRQLKGFRAGEA